MKAAAAHDALVLRAELLARTRAFFGARGVLEVETPALSACAVSDPAIDSIEAQVACLGAGPQYLQSSPEFAMKRLLANGSGDIFQICRVFRDGELGRWHQPEFTLLEWYRVGWDERALMDEVEALVTELLEGCGSGVAGTERSSYADLFAATLGCDPLGDTGSVREALEARRIAVPGGLDGDALLDLALATVVTPALDPKMLTFVYDYPPSQCALARIKPGPQPVAARFEAFLGGVELANGFHELTDPREQLERFERELESRRRAGRSAPPIDRDFLQALAKGLPDCAGVALGFDRLVAIALGAERLDDALAFTHDG